LANKNRDETEKATNRKDDQSDFELNASPNGNLQGEEVLESEALVYDPQHRLDGFHRSAVTCTTTQGMQKVKC
jgi:hypothetical protein